MCVFKEKTCPDFLYLCSSKSSFPTGQLNLPLFGISSLFSVYQGPINPLYQDTCTKYTRGILDPLVSILPLEVALQNICIQQS